MRRPVTLAPTPAPAPARSFAPALGASLGLCFAAALAGASLGCASDATTGATDPGPDASAPTTPVSCPAREPSKLDPYPLRAFVFDSDRDTPMAGAEVEVRRRSDDSVITKATTNVEGQADLAVTTAGKLLDITLRASAPSTSPDHVPTRVEIQGGQIGAAVQLVVYTKSALQARASAAGVSWDGTKAVVQVGINRCNDGQAPTPPIEAASIRVTPGTTTSYALGDGLFDPQLRLTSAYGGGTDFGVTPGNITITTVENGRSNTYATEAELGVNLFALFQP